LFRTESMWRDNEDGRGSGGGSGCSLGSGENRAGGCVDCGGGSGGQSVLGGETGGLVSD
jgi:hypothetical protein